MADVSQAGLGGGGRLVAETNLLNISNMSKEAERKDEDVLDLLEDHLIEEYLGGDRVEAFFERHLSKFRDATPDGEQRLEWSAVFEDYQREFEDLLESFLRKKGISNSDFRDMCREVLEGEDATDDQRRVVETVLSLIDYDSFIRMMSARAMFEFYGK